MCRTISMRELRDVRYLPTQSIDPSGSLSLCIIALRYGNPQCRHFIDFDTRSNAHLPCELPGHDKRQTGECIKSSNVIQ